MVLAGGKVIEQGSHEELLAADGRYAQLFRLQAERFTEDEAESEAVDAADLAGDADAAGETEVDLATALEAAP